MALPPQFMKNFKKGKEAEGKAEPGDSKKEDAAEKGKKHHNAKTEAIKKLAKKGK